METCIVRMLERSPTERLDPRKPHRFNLECGYLADTAPLAAKPGIVTREKGRMVSILFNAEQEIPEALHGLADLWARTITRDAGMRIQGEIVVRFDIVDGARGDRVVRAEQLADWLHLIAEKWGERRAVRRMLWRHHIRLPRELVH